MGYFYGYKFTEMGVLLQWESLFSRCGNFGPQDEQPTPRSHSVRARRDVERHVRSQSSQLSIEIKFWPDPLKKLRVWAVQVTHEPYTLELERTRLGVRVKAHSSHGDGLDAWNCLVHDFYEFQNIDLIIPT